MPRAQHARVRPHPSHRDGGAGWVDLMRDDRPAPQASGPGCGPAGPPAKRLTRRSVGRFVPEADLGSAGGPPRRIPTISHSRREEPNRRLRHPSGQLAFPCERRLKMALAAPLLTYTAPLGPKSTDSRGQPREPVVYPRGAARIRTGDKGFAVLCLTTWPRRRCRKNVTAPRTVTIASVAPALATPLETAARDPARRPQAVDSRIVHPRRSDGDRDHPLRASVPGSSTIPSAGFRTDSTASSS